MSNRAVGIIITNDKDQLLLVKRASLAVSSPDKWDNVGGITNEDESYEDAAKRYLVKTLNFEEDNIPPLKELFVFEEAENDIGGLYDVQLYEMRVDETPELQDLNNYQELRWFDKTELKDADLTIYIIEDFKRLGYISE